MIFQGEEMSIGIRGFTIGYDYYAPQVRKLADLQTLVYTSLSK